jgi:hypothetical protein
VTRTPIGVIGAVAIAFEREATVFVDAVRGRPDRTHTTYAEALRTHRVATAVLSATERVPQRVDTPAGPAAPGKCSDG